MSELYQLISLYFRFGLSNKEILTILAHSDGIIISNSTLKRKLKLLGFFRRKHHSDLLDVACFILTQCETSGSLHGYRWVHLKCKQFGYNISRDTIYHLMYLLDPNGMQQRRRKRLKRRQYLSPGPNFVWHIDSYDKLKPYGIAINGCIDGFSRNVIWREAATTNNDPKVIANYFMNAVREKGGCPKRVRVDLGTENTFVENMQKFLRRRHDDDFAGERSFLSGKSTFNQRIEWYWGLLRREIAQYFMDLFSVLGNDTNDLYCGDYLDNNLIQFCFLEIIQANLDEVRGLWNTHVLQSKSIDENSGRRPLLMYTFPQLHHAEDHLCPVDDTDVTICAEETIPKLLTFVDETVFQLCMALMEEYRLSAPSDCNEARDLYINDIHVIL